MRLRRTGAKEVRGRNPKRTLITEGYGMDNNSLRIDLCQELRKLLEQMEALSASPDAMLYDFTRVSTRIDIVCDLLTKLDEKERV